jgi:protein kinase-like protein
VAESLDLLYFLFSEVLGALLLFSAGFLAFVGPPNWPKRILAGLLAVLGLLQAIVVQFLPGYLPDTAYLPYHGPTFSWILDLFLIAGLLTTAFFWLYPKRPPLRSWHTVVLGGAALAYGGGAALFALDHAQLLATWPVNNGGAEYTLLYRISLQQGGIVFGSLMALSAMSRAREMDDATRRGAFVLVPLLMFPALSGAFGRYPLAIQRYLTGQELVQPTVPPGDCCGLALGLFVLLLIVPLGVVLWTAVRWRARLPLALALVALFAAPTFWFTTFDFSDNGIIVIALGPLVAIQRYGALGTAPRPERDPLLAAIVGACMFLWIDLLALLLLPGSPLALSVGAIVGLMMGGAAAFAVAPGLFQGRGPWAPAGDADARLSTYHAALQAELDRGSNGASLDRLRKLRAQLRVSEQEHAAMEVALRVAPAKGQGVLAQGERFLGRYLVQRRLGEGGAGTTWLCRDELVSRDVVLKALRPDTGSAEGVDSLVREARAIGALQHPNVVALHDVQRVGDEAFIVMEHVSGGSLEDRLARGRVAAEEFRRLAEDLLAALAAVHDAGLVHRDVKPSNILLARDGHAKLADFGVAHLPGFETTVGGGRDGSSAVGTIRYMSPEQARGKRVTAQSDLFGAAATLYETWTGEPYLQPKPGESAAELQIRAAFRGKFAAPFDGPAELRRWFAKALEPSPDKRFAGADGMRAALGKALPALQDA